MTCPADQTDWASGVLIIMAFGYPHTLTVHNTVFFEDK